MYNCSRCGKEFKRQPALISGNAVYCRKCKNNKEVQRRTMFENLMNRYSANNSNTQDVVIDYHVGTRPPENISNSETSTHTGGYIRPSSGTMFNTTYSSPTYPYPYQGTTSFSVTDADRYYQPENPMCASRDNMPLLRKIKYV